jgi:hypothetical protein
VANTTGPIGFVVPWAPANSSFHMFPGPGAHMQFVAGRRPRRPCNPSQAIATKCKERKVSCPSFDQSNLLSSIQRAQSRSQLSGRSISCFRFARQTAAADHVYLGREVR